MGKLEHDAAAANPYHRTRFDRQYSDSERQLLIHDCNVRTGITVASLRSETMERLRSLVNVTRSEQQVEEEEARSFLDPNEEPRVFRFVAGPSSRRSLLVGTVGSREFVDSFLVGGAEFIRGGRSLREVVSHIRQTGGMEAAATQEPWLEPASRLSAAFDFDRLARQLIFVRRATDSEAASCPGGRGTYIEEGQHRAIVAAWEITQRNQTHQSVAYLRGVNRQGHVWGDDFWAVELPLRSRLAGAAAAACALLAVRSLARWLCPLRPRPRSRPRLSPSPSSRPGEGQARGRGVNEGARAWAEGAAGARLRHAAARGGCE